VTPYALLIDAKVSDKPAVLIIKFKLEAVALPEQRYISTTPHDVTYQNTATSKHFTKMTHHMLQLKLNDR